MPGTSPTDYLDSINWGSSTAETTSTLGTDRLDVRVPPTQNHLGGLQISRMRQLLVAMSEYFKGGARLRVIKQSSNPFGASETGYYVSNNGVAYQVVDGTQNAIGIRQQTVAASATPTFNVASGEIVLYTAAQNFTPVITAGHIGAVLRLYITQDGTGSRTVTWPANFKKAGGTLTLTTTAGARDIIVMSWDNTNSVWVENSRALAVA